MLLSCITPPSDAEVIQIVTLAELKANLRIAYTKEDTLATDCIRWAYSYLDGRYGFLNGRALLTQTWTLHLPGFKRWRLGADANTRPIDKWEDSDTIDLPLPALQSVQWVKYRDATGTVQTLYNSVSGSEVATDVFAITKGEGWGRLTRLVGKSWPSTQEHPEAVEIRFTAGFGNAADIRSLHPGIRRGMLVLATDYFKNREDTYADERKLQISRRLINGLRHSVGKYILAQRVYE
jgi:uncharacterized phiE125 gp8 family phage protein